VSRGLASSSRSFRLLQPGETGRELTDFEQRRVKLEAAARASAYKRADPVEQVIIEGIMSRVAADEEVDPEEILEVVA